MFPIQQDECDQRADASSMPLGPPLSSNHPSPIVDDARYDIPQDETISAKKMEADFY